MGAIIISGAEVAKQIREELKQEVDQLKTRTGVVPGLVTILVGENPASVSYVTAKQKTSKTRLVSAKSAAKQSALFSMCRIRNLQKT